MNKKFLYTIILLFLASCSLSKKDFKKKDKSIEIFKKIQPIKKEFNSGLKINTKNNFKQNPFLNNNSNNNGKINFDTNFEKVSNYKFKKIKKFDSNQPELLFTNEDEIIFFDGKGRIFKLIKI